MFFLYIHGGWREREEARFLALPLLKVCCGANTNTFFFIIICSGRPVLAHSSFVCTIFIITVTRRQSWSQIWKNVSIKILKWEPFQALRQQNWTRFMCLLCGQSVAGSLCLQVPSGKSAKLVWKYDFHLCPCMTPRWVTWGASVVRQVFHECRRLLSWWLCWTCKIWRSEFPVDNAGGKLEIKNNASTWTHLPQTKYIWISTTKVVADMELALTRSSCVFEKFEHLIGWNVFEGQWFKVLTNFKKKRFYHIKVS